MARAEMTKKELLAELEEREERLQESEGRWREFVDGAGDLVTQVDGKGQFLYVNGAVRKIFGLEPEECVGKLAFEFIHPEDQERTMASFAGWVGDRVRSASFENRQVAKSGEVHHMLWTVNPRYDEEGNMRELWSIARDITERKQTEETLRQNEHIVSSSSDMIALLDEKFHYLSANAAYAETFNKASDEFIGSTVSAVFGEEFFDEVIKPSALRCLSGEIVSYQDWFDFPAYGSRYMEINYYPYIDADNQIKGIVVNGRDITERKQAEEELQRHRDHLEELVQERTTALEETNVQLQQEIEEGKQREEVIRQQTEEILEMSTPVMQMWEGVVVAPLIGMLDSQRTQRFMEVLLQRIVDTNSPVALVDITGVPLIDTQTAQNLIETVGAVQLLGAKVILTGVRPAIAQTLVHLGIDLSDVETCSSLAAGLRLALGGNGIPCGTNKRRL
jgi:PAS domain S-box-containing protein